MATKRTCPYVLIFTRRLGTMEVENHLRCEAPAGHKGSHRVREGGKWVTLRAIGDTTMARKTTVSNPHGLTGWHPVAIAAFEADFGRRLTLDEAVAICANTLATVRK